MRIRILAVLSTRLHRDRGRPVLRRWPIALRLDHAVSVVTLLLLSSITVNLFSQADTQGVRAPSPIVPLQPAPRPADGTEHRPPRGYQMTTVYDRVSNHTRLTVMPVRKAGRSSDRASVSFAVSITYPGRDLTTVPDSVEFLFTAYAPARSGWALASPGPLRLLVDDSLEVKVPNVSYQRLPVRFTARGRSEMAVFRVATPDLIALATSTHGQLRVGRFTIELDANGLEGLRALSHRLTPPGP